MLSFRRISQSFLACLTAGVLLSGPVAAQDLRAERDRLAAHIQANPDDDQATYRFVVIATELRDYEAGIGALERLLMFNPNLSRARKELGFLYARLGNWEIAGQHLRAARDSGTLDPAQRAQIDAQLPEVEKRAQPDRLSIRLQTGVRSQSNANYFPAANLFQIGGASQLSLGRPRSEVNTFQLVHASHEYDFGGRGDRLETHVSAYATEQFNLPQYSVALFTGSIGPRFVVPQGMVDGLSVRPYVSGAVTLLGSTNYLNAGSAGASVRMDLAPNFWIEPGAEWRTLSVNTGRALGFGVLPLATLSTIATGEAVTAYVGSAYPLMDRVRLDGRFAYTRANASNAVQSSDQFDAQAMARIEVDPPHPAFARRWSIAPYARFTHLRFDAPNPLVSPWAARRDAAWTYGVLLEAPVTPMLGFAGNLEFSRNDSNLPNYSTQNVSVSFGPTAKF
ncbi:hypothetical protein AMST5_02117 [freshwater sediment metagenome]|uniref:DUF560 domain-containing protein n=1 Tax=freshwater sediment metagenome TaxID=556182 RepID=A0AA48M258_9ZZZZ